MQLKFDDDFSSITDKKINFYNSLEDLPLKIHDFIINTTNNFYFYNEINKKMYCSKCLVKLKKYQCPTCLKEYHKKSNCKINVYNESDMDSQTLSFYFFDYQDDNLFLYYSECEVYVMGIKEYHKYHKFVVKNIFRIDKYGLTDMITNIFYLYQDYQKLESLFSQESYLYVDNLEILKKFSFYKYSQIWELKDYLNNRLVNLFMITFYPIHFPQYEYLVKMRLYALACEATPLFTSKIFKENFGVDKTFLPYLKKINIDLNDLEILKIIPIQNKRILSFFSSDVKASKQISKVTSLIKVYNYFKKSNLNKYHIYAYAIYLEMCQELKLDLHDKDVLFPQDFLVTYESITKQIAMIEDKKNNMIIKELYNIYNINTFEDDTYKVFPASSVEELVDESSQMNNCVRTYVGNIVSYASQIYFLRRKDNLNKSLVTVELKNGKIVQALAKNNTTPNKEILSFLDKWQSNIIPVAFTKE